MDIIKIEIYWISIAGSEFGYLWTESSKDMLGSLPIYDMNLFGWPKSAAITL